MKNVKKLASLLLVLVMMFALAVPAMAADGGTITIKSARTGESYYLFKIFDLDYSETTDSETGSTAYNYVYTISDQSNWYEFVTTGAGKDYVDLTHYKTIYDDAGNVMKTIYSVTQATDTTEGEFADFATYARDYLDTKNAGQTAEGGFTIGWTAKKVAETTADLVFDGLEYGYYMIYGSVGTVVGLTTNDSNVTVTSKNTTPKIDKQVQEDSTGIWGDVDTAEIGETVNFRATLTNINNISKLVFHDVLSEGLTLKEESIVVTQINSGYHGVEAFTKIVDAKNYSYATVENSEQNTGMYDDGMHWTLSFTQDFIDTLTGYDSLEITYSATVNEKALILGSATTTTTTTGDKYNPNKTQLRYGNAQYTVWDETKTFVFDVEIFKYTDISGNSHPLAGAEFQLRKGISDGNGNYTPVYAVLKTVKGESSTYYQLDHWSEKEDDATTITSDANGLIYITGLDADLYRLIETKAPEGYNLKQDPIRFKITQDGVLAINTGTDATGTNYIYADRIEVENNTGAELPSTGGVGTTIFYVVGAVLMVGAVVLLVTKKRMGEN